MEPDDLVEIIIRTGGERGTEGFFLERGLLGFLVFRKGTVKTREERLRQ